MSRIVFFICFLNSILSFSQSQSFLSDKEFSVLQGKARALMNSNADSAIIVSDRMELSENYMHKAFAFGIKSYLYQAKGDSFKSNQFYEKAFEALHKVRPSAERIKMNAYILNFGGLSDWKRGNFNEALKKYQAGKKMSEEAGDLVQIVKFNNNIALVNGEVGNYTLAIKASKESDAVMDANQDLYTAEQFNVGKSNVNLNLGIFYEKSYSLSKSKTFLLDSSAFYYKKAILYSKQLFDNKIQAQKNLANIYYLKKEYEDAEKIYQSTLLITKQNKMISEYCNTSYNLGDLYFETKKYQEALVLFKRVDSIYKSDNTNRLEYIRSNYYQSKIYKAFGDNESAFKHSQIYLDNFEKFESDLNKETLNVNSNQSNHDLKKEMDDLQDEYKNKVLLKNSLIAFFSVFFMILVVLLIVNYKRRKVAEQKITAVLEEYKSNSGGLISKPVLERTVDNAFKDDNKVAKDTSSISLDNEKDIMLRLKSLEDKLFYLRPEFTQQEVAKKIKTNTTYLSYVVNKNYGKSFSVYYNELRINHAVNEIINNPRYREYTTQAIAESVGFKNADSFASSFKKKTGVTPYQFINEIKKRELV